MRVLTITSLFPRGAASHHGVFVRQRASAIRDLGAEVRVISPIPYVPPGPVPERYARLRGAPREATVDGMAVRYPRYPMIPKVGLRLQVRGYARGIRAAVREELERFRPDIIDSHYLYPDACGVERLARELGFPFACSARGSDVYVLGRIAAARRRIRSALSRAAAVIAVSEDLARTMRREDLHQGPVEVIPNGIDPERFFPRPRKDTRDRLGLSGSGPLAVCVGILAPVRGQELLLRALAEPGAPGELRACLVGEGPDGERLRELARSLGIEGRVTFAGSRPHEEIPLWFAASDLSVQLNRSAGSPNAVLESLACGVPVLATDIPAMREVIRSPADGLLVPPSPPEVARALAALCGKVAGPRETPGPVRTWLQVGGEVLSCFETALGRGRGS